MQRTVMRPVLGTSLGLNVALVVVVVGLVAMPTTSPKVASGADDEQPMQGTVDLLLVEYFLWPQVDPSARNNFDEGFFGVSELEQGTLNPTYTTLSKLPATGSCVILQTHIQLPDEQWNTSYEHADCGPKAFGVVESMDHFGGRIGVLFVNAKWAEVSHEAFFIKVDPAETWRYRQFSGHMPLHYVVPEETATGTRHHDVRYEQVPFTGRILLTYHGLVDWQRD